MNRWNIPSWLEKEVKARDKKCVYCGTEMIGKVPRGSSRSKAATWEHIINDETIVSRENIARCCSSCNSSKGTKDLSAWMNSKYCKEHGITEDTVAEIVKNALRKQPHKISSENSGIVV
jgi:hypothetical protein